MGQVKEGKVFASLGLSPFSAIGQVSLHLFVFGVPEFQDKENWTALFQMPWGL